MTPISSTSPAIRHRSRHRPLQDRRPLGPQLPERPPRRPDQRRHERRRLQPASHPQVVEETIAQNHRRNMGRDNSSVTHFSTLKPASQQRTIWFAVSARPGQDRSNPLAGSIDPVTPVDIYIVEQIHAVDGIADSDSDQPRSAPGARENWHRARAAAIARAVDRQIHAPESRRGKNFPQGP